MTGKIFSFTEQDFLNPNKVKIIYGVAGRGKSSVVVKYLQDHNIPFLWTTSTNKLKRDAMKRYGCDAATVASALFKTVNGVHYFEERKPDIKTIVIDEILQTSPKVLDYIRKYKGEYNFIILTDIKQMLAQEGKIR